MNAYAILIVNDHIEQLRREAAERRARPGRVAGDRPPDRDRADQPPSAISAPASMVQPIIPDPDGYPYRG